MEDGVTVCYTQKIQNECSGTLTIKGINIPCNRGYYNPLGKIWSSVRKRVLEKYGVHVSATFKYNTRIIVCDFFVDNAYGETKKISKAVLCQRFEINFSNIMADFEDAIEAFIEDEENGYVPYINLFKESKGKPDKEKCEEMFNTFLRKINLRNPVEKYSQEELKIIKRDREKRKEEKRLRKLKGFFRKEIIENTGKYFDELGHAPTPEEISDLANAKVIEHLAQEEAAKAEKDIWGWAFIESFN